MMSGVRNRKIDLLRGWLIILVVVGHVVVGSIHSQPIRYAIYAFHMPLFIALTGYLINANWLRQAPLGDVAKRYWFRVIIPFALAFGVFTGILAFHAWQEGRLSAQWFLGELITPYYHLWFIPTLLIWVASFAVLQRCKISMVWILPISLAASSLWASGQFDQLPSLIAALLDKKVVYFYAFFVLGVVLRQTEWAGSQWLARPWVRFGLAAVVVASFTVYWQQIGLEPSWTQSVAWMGLNTTLVLGCLHYVLAGSADYSTYSSPLIESIGRLSLPIYLWHVLPLFFLKGFDVHETYLGIYYAVAVVSSILIVWLVLRFEHHSQWLDRWVYGVSRP